MNISDYLRIVRGNWILILVTTLLGLLCGGAALLLIPRSYTSNTQLFVSIQGSNSVSELEQANSFGEARVQSYVRTVTEPVVLQPVIDSLGLDLRPDDLARSVKASTEMNTVLINISVTDRSPAKAAAIAQAVSTSLVTAVDNLERPRQGGLSPVSLSVTRPAVAPDFQSAPNTRMSLAVGLLGGFVLGLFAAVFRTTSDRRIRAEADLRLVTDAPLLGRLAFDQDSTRKPLLTQAAPQSARAESYRQLRTNLQAANIVGNAKTVLVTSSLRGEGKSTTATNLAIALAQDGKKVCLVDADLRCPTVDRYLGLDGHAGLTTALAGDADVDDLLHLWGEDKLYVLTSGQIPPNPSELLGSDAMKQLINRLEQAFDAVVIDAPPVIPVTDAAVLARHVGGVVVVVNTQSTRRHDVEQTLQALKLVDAELLGIVLNGLKFKKSDAYPYSDAGPNRRTPPADKGLHQAGPVHESRR